LAIDQAPNVVAVTPTHITMRGQMKTLLYDAEPVILEDHEADTQGANLRGRRIYWEELPVEDIICRAQKNERPS
jgi:hypothetical protein